MKGFTTKALNTPFLKQDAHRSIHMPIYQTGHFDFDSSEEIELAFKGKKPRHMYSRITNPTVEHFEQKIKNISGALDVLALASGMAAISNTIIALCGAGDNIITTKRLFGNSLSLFTKTLKPWGLEVKYADFTQPQSIKKFIDDKTRLIFLETMTNPQLEVADLETITKIANENQIPLIVDSSITPFYFCSLKELGVPVEVLSSTKYISGGATSIGGLIIDYGTFDWAFNPNCAPFKKQFGPYAFMNKLRKESYRNFGACLSPQTAYLQSLGLETLPLRIERTSENALTIAKLLEKHPKVKSVNYPGLKNSPGHNMAKKQFGPIFGGMLTFELGSKKECFDFMDSLTIIRRATNFNDNRSLIIHPASTIFCEFNKEELKNMTVSNTMIRFSAGIEEIDDLIEDIKGALEKI